MTRSGTAGVSSSSTPAAGSVTSQGMAARVAAQAELAIEPQRRGAARGRRDGGYHRHRRGRGAGPAPRRQAGRASPPTRSTGPGPEADAAALWNLGLGEPWPVSALHGRGSGDLLDAVLEALPQAPPEPEDPPAGGPRRVALLGKPNVGKSSLLNQLAGTERVVVDAVAGTTRDPVDELIELGGRELDVRRHRRDPAPGPPGQRGRLLRQPAHAGGAGQGRGGGRAPRRPRAADRAGPAHHHDGHRVRPGAWSSPSTSGTSWTRTGATSWSARSSASWPGWPGRRG